MRAATQSRRTPMSERSRRCSWKPGLDGGRQEDVQHAMVMEAARVAPLVAMPEAAAALEVGSSSEEEVQVSKETIVLN